MPQDRPNDSSRPTPVQPSRGRFVLRRAAIVGLLLAACHGAPPETQPGSRHDENVISAAELADTRLATLYDVVRELRPGWLSRRYAGGLNGQGGDPVVYADDQLVGGIGLLRSWMPSSAATLRFFPLSEAQGRFGSGVRSAVVQIETPRGTASVPP